MATISKQRLRHEFAEASGLVFDLDGTLADTFSDLAASVNYVRGLRGLEPLALEEVKNHVGYGVRNLISQCVPCEYDELDSMVRLFRDYYSEHLLDHTHLYPGTLEALKALEGIPKAVLSNKPEAQTKAIVTGLGLSPYFKGIFGGDSFAQMKPHPLATLSVLEFLSAAPQYAWVVGDSEVDAKAARKVGARVALVTWGLSDLETARSLGPDLILSAWSDLFLEA